jgi:hypothetical protein
MKPVKKVIASRKGKPGAKEPKFRVTSDGSMRVTSTGEARVTS